MQTSLEYCLLEKSVVSDFDRVCGNRSDKLYRESDLRVMQHVYDANFFINIP